MFAQGQAFQIENRAFRPCDVGVKKNLGANGVKTSVLYHKAGRRASGRTKKQAKFVKVLSL